MNHAPDLTAEGMVRDLTHFIQALRDTVKLFVYAWNRRQLFRRAHPKYPAHLSDFVYP